MPGEIEVPLEHAHEHIEKAHEEQHGEGDGPKDGAGKERAGKDHDGWTRFIAVVTALLAVVAAIGALRAGLLVNEALLAKNDEISHRTQATDQWNYYQSKSIKGVVYATTAALLPPGSPQAAQSRAEVARYAREQKDIQKRPKIWSIRPRRTTALRRRTWTGTTSSRFR